MAQEHTRLMKANFHGSELGINGSEVYTVQNGSSSWLDKLHFHVGLFQLNQGKKSLKYLDI